MPHAFLDERRTKVVELISASPRDEHPAYLSELMTICAELEADELGEDAAHFVKRIRHCALVVGYMSWGEAEREWTRQRQALPWRERLKTPKRPSGDNIAAILKREKNRAREAVFGAAPDPAWHSIWHPGYTVTRHPGGVIVTNTEVQKTTRLIPLNEISNWMGTTRDVLLEYTAKERS